LYLGNGRVGIGSENPQNLFQVEGSGTDAGGASNVNDVVARFRRTGSGHSAASVDSSSGRDSIIYLAENGQAFWDVRHDSDATHSFNIRYHVGTGENISLLRILLFNIIKHFFASCY
jgi:hypothetical protein